MKTWIKILIALFLIGIIAGILGYFFVYNKPHTDYSKAKTEISLNAEKLYESFIENTTEAEQQFNGRVLEVEGSLNGWETSNELVIVVFAFGEGMFGPEGVRCTMLPEFSEKAKGLTKGDFIRLKGLCTGYTGVDVIMDKCSIVE
jgi:uncharacterized membrane protein